MKIESFTLQYDEAEWRAALRIESAETVRYLLTSGTAMSLHLFGRIAETCGLVMRDQQCYFDPAGNQFKMRVLTDRVDFSPSINKGGRRQWSPRLWSENADTLAGYYVADLASFPALDVFVLPMAWVRRWAGPDERGMMERGVFMRRISDEREQLPLAI